MEQATSQLTRGEGQALALPLDSPERVVRLIFGGRSALHFFRPLKLDDWLGYLKELRSEILSEQDRWSSVSCWAEAAAWLWDQAILRVEGYGGIEPCDLGALRARMPVQHKAAAVALLQQVIAIAGADPFELAADSVQVRLEAAWNLEIYDQLVHFFRPPTQQEAIEYSRLNASYYRSRGRRDGATRIQIPPRLKQLSQLYDRLIVGTGGYSWAEGVSVQNAMDALHKQAAVQALFEPPEEAA